MAHAGAAQTQSAAPRPPSSQGRVLFFKVDHAREIDRFIDCFGGPLSQTAADLCGERLLETAS